MNRLCSFFTSLFSFSGRVSRMEYNIFLCVNALFSTLLGMTDGLALKIPGDGVPPLMTIYLAAAFIPLMSETARRAHDIGKDFSWALMSLVPLLGQGIMLVLMFREGESGANMYGDAPGSGYSESEAEDDENKTVEEPAARRTAEAHPGSSYSRMARRMSSPHRKC